MLILPTTNNLTANAYVDLAYWNTYWTDRNQESALVDIDDEQKQEAILYATRDVDGRPWYGERKDTDQPLDWLRIGARDGRRIFEATELPRKLQEAVCERGRDHVLVRKINEATNPQEELESLKLGPLAIRFDREKVAVVVENHFVEQLLADLYVGTVHSMEIVRA